MGRRSFLFGLGTGLIIMCLVFYAVDSFYTSGATEVEAALTNEEIIAKATKLGMVMFSDLPRQPDKTEKGDSSLNLADSDITDAEIITRATLLGMSFQEENAAVILADEKPVDVEIPQGLTSAEVAKVLRDAGVIDDEKPFIDYLVSRGMSKSVRYGSYSIKKGSSYDDILELINVKQR